jgi:hypothetical protein
MSERELTELLIGVDFGKPAKSPPRYYRSDVTGNMYDYKKYNNHGHGGNKYGYEDLPSDGYPYTIIYD